MENRLKNYVIETRKGFATGAHTYDVWRLFRDTKTRKLVGSFVTKADAEDYCKYKNKEQST